MGDARRPAGEPEGERGPLALIDLHCHSSGSFDSLADPRSIMKAALARGLTHLAITDHDRVEVALRARDEAPDGLTLIVGEEIKTRDGDLVAAFIEKLVPPGMTALETIQAVREQGGLVGVPHPFDRIRGYGRKSGARLEDIADRIDWIEAYNARVVGGSANERAAEFAHEQGLPGICASDSHTVLEVGVCYNAVEGDPGTPQGLLAALPTVDMHPSRATIYVRAWTPVAKTIQKLRGNGRIRPAAISGDAK
jgi:predicted metal-dependent phosphoesterase TrpH